MLSKKIGIFIVLLFVMLAVALNVRGNKSTLPLVAIANYGPHVSLEASIKGLKEQMAKEGFIENKTVRYDIADVGFDHTLISSMLMELKSHHPAVMVVMATPVAQFAKGHIHDIPLIYNVITDPVSAKLIQKENESHDNMTGSSDRQDLKALLVFAKTLLPQAKTVGLLYATSDSNDVALLRMMRRAASSVGLSVVAIPIAEAREISIRVREFQGKVDFIYVGSSGPILPTLPVIASEATRMAIPIFNVEEQAVRDGLALASFGVSYESVGKRAGHLTAACLKGKSVSQLAPVYPTVLDHHALINRKKAAQLNIIVPKQYPTVG